MRVLAPFLSTLAAVVTIVAGVLRIRWTEVQRRVYESSHVGREALPDWVKKAATIWLVTVFGTVTFLILFVIVKTVIDLSA